MNQIATKPQRKYTPKPQTLVDTGHWRISNEAMVKIKEMEKANGK